MAMNERIFRRLSDKWLIKQAFLMDVYFLMINDLRFSSLRSRQGIRYAKVSKHLKDNYGIELEPYQLKYMVSLMRVKKMG